LLSGEVCNVIVRLSGDVTVQIELRDKRAATDLPLRVHVREVSQHEVAGVDADVVPLIAQPLEVWAKTYRLL